MYVQYSQGLPGVVINEDAKTIYIDTAQGDYAKKLEAVYEHYLSNDLEYFAVSQEYAAGFYEFTDSFSVASMLRRVVPGQRRLGAEKVFQYVKGQIIGPISFGLTVCDQDKKTVIYNEEFRDCLVKVLTMKAIWQLKKLKECYPQSKIIIFVDEPYLMSLGSSYFNIPLEKVIGMLDEIFERIHNEGGHTGLHCCGNTDWKALLDTSIDVLSLDAYGYLDKLFLYRKDLDNFLGEGGVLACGIVPTFSEDSSLPDKDLLINKLRVIEGSCLITPSCGLSGVSMKRAEDIFDLTVGVTRGLSSPN